MAAQWALECYCICSLLTSQSAITCSLRHVLVDSAVEQFVVMSALMGAGKKAIKTKSGKNSKKKKMTAAIANRSDFIGNHKIAISKNLSHKSTYLTPFSRKSPEFLKMWPEYDRFLCLTE